MLLQTNPKMIFPQCEASKSLNQSLERRGLVVKVFDSSAEAGISHVGSNPGYAGSALVSLGKALDYDCFSPPRSKWVSVRVEVVIVFD